MYALAMKPLIAAIFVSTCPADPVFVTTDPVGSTSIDPGSTGSTNPTSSGSTSSTGSTGSAPSSSSAAADPSSSSADPNSGSTSSTSSGSTSSTSSTCSSCGPDDACPLGQICLSSGLCAQACSLLVWHEATTEAMYDTPCAAGVGDCPQTCLPPPIGLGGTCQSDPLLLDDIGACLDDSGSPLCHSVGDT